MLLNIVEFLHLMQGETQASFLLRQQETFFTYRRGQVKYILLRW